MGKLAVAKADLVRALLVFQFYQWACMLQIDERQRRFYTQDVSGETQHLMQLELIKFLHQNKQFLPSIYFLPDISSHVN